MSAQNTPITFTSEEQLDLSRLEQNLDVFNTLRQVLQQGIYPGGAAVAVIRCQQLAESLVKNTADQVDAIRKQATERAAGSQAEEKKS